jgi:hypothetical protein
MRKRISVILVLTACLCGTKGVFSKDNWEFVTQYISPTFDNSLDLPTRFWNLTIMRDVLYRYDPEVPRVFVDMRAEGKNDGSGWMNAFHTIQAAIDSLGENGGWIFVAEGEYRESLHMKRRLSLFGGFSGVELDLRDRDCVRHPSVLIGDGSKSVVFMEHCTLLDGFTVQNGGGESGAGICTGGWLSVIHNNVIRDNHSSWTGGGICVNGDAYSEEYAPVIERNLIIRNSGQCGSGVAVRYARALFAHNTVANNSGGDRSRGIEILQRTLAEPTVLNSIFWNNGNEVYNQVGNTGPVFFTYNCVQDQEDYGEGIIHDNPQFEDTTSGDFHLKEGSPCINAGIPHAFNDPDGTAGDLGAFCAYRHNVDGGTPITFESSPVSGIPVSIEGKMCLTPVSVKWYPGYSHQIGAVQYYRVNERVAYAFTGWNDGGDRFHLIIGEEIPKTYTAGYKLQYYLDITGEPREVAVRGEGWYDSDSNAEVSADTVTDIGGGVRYRFLKWEGIGAGGVTSDQPRIQVAMTGPIQEKLVTQIQYRLETRVFPDTAEGCRIVAAPAGPWYSSGEAVTLGAESVNPHYRFFKWSEGAASPDGSLTLTVNGPSSVTGYFEYLSHPPSILSLPDTSVSEDDTLSLSMDWLYGRVQDAGGKQGHLKLSFLGGAHFTFIQDTIHQAFLILPAHDWNGKAPVVFRAEDTTGVADQDTFMIAVQSVPDPPGSFDLSSPSQGAVFSIPGDGIRFAWTESENVDANDTVRYHFFMNKAPSHLEADAAVDTVVNGTLVKIPIPNIGLYYWGVMAFDTQGYSAWAEQTFSIQFTTGVESRESGIPLRFDVGPNYPNPFNPSTRFEFQLPRDARVRLEIYDVLGSAVRSFPEQVQRAGFHQIAWDGKNDKGQPAPSGVYYARVRLEDRVFIRKLTLTR